MTCPNCETPSETQWKYCPECGAELPSPLEHLFIQGVLTEKTKKKLDRAISPGDTKILLFKGDLLQDDNCFIGEFDIELIGRPSIL